MRNSGLPRGPTSDDSEEADEIIDWHDIFVRLGRGLPQSLGLTLLGLAIGFLACLTSTRYVPIATTTQVVFSFPGSDKGQYPDGTRFSTDDLVSVDVIEDAIKHEGLNPSAEFLAEVQSGLTIEGVIPDDVAKERDKLRSLGELPPVYIPDEFSLSLTLPKTFPLFSQQRKTLLIGIIDAYRAKFRRTFAKLPPNFGGAFAALHGVNYFEYELILRQELGTMIDYLRQKAIEAKGFRSEDTTLSFDDLGDHAVIFKNVRLDDVLGQIVSKGISRDPEAQLRKIDYDLRNYREAEGQDEAEQRLLAQLLSQTEQRSQNNVLTVKSEIGQQRSGAPILDQGLIDSLLANDTYNMLIRDTLDGAPKLNDIQASETRLLEERKVVEAFARRPESNRAAEVAAIDKSLTGLEAGYNQLIDDVRRTNDDYIRHQYANVIAVAVPPATQGTLRTLARASLIGAILGVVIGAALSLLGVSPGAGRRRRPSVAQ